MTEKETNLIEQVNEQIERQRQNTRSSLFNISSAMQKLQARFEHYGFKKVMVSISGGYDSDVMLDMLLRCCPKEIFTFVFFDTGIEYEATKRHLDYLEKKYDIIIDRQRAAVPVPLGVKKYGLPFLSKYASEMIHRLQRNKFDFAGDGNKDFDELLSKYPKCKVALKWWCNQHPKNSSFNIARFYALKEFMIANPPDFAISAQCCEGAKKQPSHKYEKANKFDCKCLGLRKSEGGIRTTVYKNCFTYDSSSSIQNYRPIWWFTDADKQTYVDYYLLVLSDCYIVYGMTRTGCAGCPFNSKFENDLEILKQHEPKLYKAVIAIFGKAYEYTRKYREFKARMRRGNVGQLSMFDDPAPPEEA